MSTDPTPGVHVCSGSTPWRLTPATVRRIRRLRYLDGHTTRDTALMVGVGRETVRRYAPGLIGKVPNDRARAIFLASGLSAPEVARRIGWRHSPAMAHKGDGSRVKRTLGLLPDYNRKVGKRYATPRLFADAETLGLIAEACGAAAWEAMPDEDSVAA